MFADRLEVQSPGGLFGNVNVENLDEEHSTRNARLMRMMEDMQIVENRGSGIRAIFQAMREANLEPPKFDDRRSSFKVILRNLTLMSREAISWLNQFSHLPLNDQQRLALVYLRQHSHIDNRDYRRLNRVDMIIAGQDLGGMVQTGLVEQTGFGRWTKYRLFDSEVGVKVNTIESGEEKVISYIKRHGSITNADCRGILQTNLHNTTYFLKKMIKKGLIKREGKHRWTRYRLP